MQMYFLKNYHVCAVLGKKHRYTNNWRVFVYYLQLKSIPVVQIIFLSDRCDKFAIWSIFVAHSHNKSRNCHIVTALCTSAILDSSQTIKKMIYGQNRQKEKKG